MVAGPGDPHPARSCNRIVATARAYRWAWNARRVWQNAFLMQSALARHNPESMAQLLQQAITVDGSIMGFASGRAPG